MTKLILTFVMVLSAASASFASECPFKNMSANSKVGLFDRASNDYNRKVATVNNSGFVQPVKRRK